MVLVDVKVRTSQRLFSLPPEALLRHGEHLRDLILDARRSLLLFVYVGEVRCVPCVARLGTGLDVVAYFEDGGRELVQLWG